MAQSHPDTIGIIAEYNPFHNGHLYQIQEIKRRTGAKHIVVVLSGDFVQRGVPAWTDKYLRTEMALCCGADLVLELPVHFAVASAQAFAFAGVSILSKLPFVDGICFGAETDDTDDLQRLAEALTKTDDKLEQDMAKLTALGMTYPAARELCLKKSYPDIFSRHPDILSSPNNILAVEYLRAIAVTKSPLTPYCIRRVDSGYHNRNLTGKFCSSRAIRAAYAESCNKRSFFAGNDAVPEAVSKLLADHTDRFPVCENDFSDLLYYRLATFWDDPTPVADGNRDLMHRMVKLLPQFTDYSSFTAQLKTKQYTYSHISRALLHCLLHIRPIAYPGARKKDLGQVLGTLTDIPYARLLGLFSGSSFLLRDVTSFPVINKPADGLRKIRSFYSADPKKADLACLMAQKDLFASDLYRQVQQKKLGANRLTPMQTSPIVKDNG